VTLLVKDNIPGQITLAIGDGANDVSMIQVPETERGDAACGVWVWWVW
jgi:hydroxymethylpyrimidine pyrophosphatase-like HAD family hydrolase